MEHSAADKYTESVQAIKQKLENQTVGKTAIIDKSSFVAITDFIVSDFAAKELKFNSWLRAEGRKLVDGDLKKYGEFHLTNSKKNEQEAKKYFAKVLEDCGVSGEVFKNSCAHYGKESPDFKGFSESWIENVQIYIEEKLKPKKKPIPKLKLKEVLQFQLKVFPSIKYAYDRDKSNNEMLKMFILEDLTFNKYAIETDDILQNAETANDPDIQKLVEQWTLKVLS